MNAHPHTQDLAITKAKKMAMYIEKALLDEALQIHPFLLAALCIIDDATRIRKHIVKTIFEGKCFSMKK